MTTITTTEQARRPGENTEASKLKVRFNGVKHGIASRLLNDDEQAAFDDHLQRLNADLEPVGYLEQKLVQGIAYALWRKDKLAIWQEASTQMQMRQALEIEAYPDKFNHLVALAEIERGVANGSLPATLERLCVAVDSTGLLSVSIKTIIDDLERIRDLLPKLKNKAMLEYDNDFEASKHLMVSHLRIAQLLERVEMLLEDTRKRHVVAGESVLALVMRYEGSLDRALYRALCELRTVQAHRFLKLKMDTAS